VTRRVPRRKVGHLTKPGYRAGNSLEGNEYADEHDIVWLDNDWQLLAPPEPDAWPEDEQRDGNTHWPKANHERFVPKSDRRTWDRITWAEARELATPDGYRIRSMEQAFRDAEARGQRVEVEAKFQCTPEDCRRLAATARKVFGKGWRAHVWVKTLSNLPGGYPAAVRRLHAASSAGFTTLLLCRGRARYRRRFNVHISYVRGALRRPIERH
jgi:hypothetical protein